MKDQQRRFGMKDHSFSQTWIKYSGNHISFVRG